MRRSGILMAISSLPSPYGIGTMGKAAYKFVDFLVKAGQTYWQILPVCPTSYGDSPYQSFSTFAGNPYFIDLDMLIEAGYLTKADCTEIFWGNDETLVDYGAVYNGRTALFRKVLEAFKKDIPADFDEFCKENAAWLSDYALFMAIKGKYDGKAWREWAPALKLRDKVALQAAEAELADAVLLWKMLQYLFWQQWKALKAYANANGIQIIGDIPIYVAGDSADVWSDSRQFLLDEENNPIEVAGCPPDGFTEDGQLWGNPLFRWEYIEKNEFAWWIQRIRYAASVYDVVRIDHFRGFESFYCIPAGDKNAKNGVWRKGPGMKLFKAVKKALGDIPIIAEDLGYLTPEVIEMLTESGYPGMKVLEFAFDPCGNSDYLPHKYPKNCVAYTGTHDNSTALGWLENAPKHEVEFAEKYLKLNKREAHNWTMMRAVWESEADTAVMQMQDLLSLDDSARMNTPSTSGSPNWCWRCKKGVYNAALAKRVYRYVERSNRL